VWNTAALMTFDLTAPFNKNNQVDVKLDWIFFDGRSFHRLYF